MIETYLRLFDEFIWYKNNQNVNYGARERVCESVRERERERERDRERETEREDPPRAPHVWSFDPLLLHCSPKCGFLRDS